MNVSILLLTIHAGGVSDSTTPSVCPLASLTICLLIVLVVVVVATPNVSISVCPPFVLVRKHVCITVINMMVCLRMCTQGKIRNHRTRRCCSFLPTSLRYCANMLLPVPACWHPFAHRQSVMGKWTAVRGCVLLFDCTRQVSSYHIFRSS